MAGLVAITPSAGFVEPWAALIIGAAVPPVCYFAISHLKARFGYDDALDAFGCHGIGGIVGGILTGLFCVPSCHGRPLAVCSTPAIPRCSSRRSWALWSRSPSSSFSILPSCLQ